MARTWRKAKALVVRQLGMPADEGQGLAEYALILAFIAIACVAALGALGSSISASSAWTIP